MELSIVIPCYKEAKDIEKNINRIKEYLKENKIDAEIIAVSDGSPDNTFDIIKNIPDIKGIGYEKNKGKGGATRFGIEHAEGDDGDQDGREVRAYAQGLQKLLKPGSFLGADGVYSDNRKQHSDGSYHHRGEDGLHLALHAGTEESGGSQGHSGQDRAAI